MWKSFQRILESSFNYGKFSPSNIFAAIEKINNCVAYWGEYGVYGRKDH